MSEPDNAVVLPGRNHAEEVMVNRYVELQQAITNQREKKGPVHASPFGISRKFRREYAVLKKRLAKLKLIVRLTPEQAERLAKHQAKAQSGDSGRVGSQEGRDDAHPRSSG